MPGGCLTLVYPGKEYATLFKDDPTAHNTYAHKKVYNGSPNDEKKCFLSWNTDSLLANVFFTLPKSMLRRYRRISRTLLPYEPIL